MKMSFKFHEQLAADFVAALTTGHEQAYRVTNCQFIVRDEFYDVEGDGGAIPAALQTLSVSAGTSKF